MGFIELYRPPPRTIGIDISRKEIDSVRQFLETETEPRLHADGYAYTWYLTYEEFIAAFLKTTAKCDQSLEADRSIANTVLDNHIHYWFRYVRDYGI